MARNSISLGGVAGMALAVGLGPIVASGCWDEREFVSSQPDADGGADDGASGRGGAPSETGEGGAPEGDAGTPGATQLAGGAPSLPSGGSAAAGSPTFASGGEPSAEGSGGEGGNGPAPEPLILKAFDDFVVSAEGWTITGDPSVTTVTHMVTGGHPDGTISSTDTGTGTWFFTAPSKYLGDASALAGGVLRFDLKVTPIEKPYAQTDVQLTNDAVTLVYDCSPEPGTSWTTYTVPLSAPGWKVGTRTGPAATAEQFVDVLSHLTRLRIRGEFNDGDDTGWLDNVYFASR